MSDSPRIKVHIEELVFDGVHPYFQELITPAIQEELDRLFFLYGVPPAVVDRGLDLSVAGGQLEVDPGESPQMIGRQIARFLHDHLNNPRTEFLPVDPADSQRQERLPDPNGLTWPRETANTPRFVTERWDPSPQRVNHPKRTTAPPKEKVNHADD